MARHAFVIRVYVSNAAGDEGADRLSLSRSFRAEEEAVAHSGKMEGHYRSKANRGDDPSYRIVVSEQDREGLPPKAEVLRVISDTRVFQHRH